MSIYLCSCFLIKNDMDKEYQLKRYKNIATGLLLLMAVIFFISFVLEKKHSDNWGYVKAFAEAAMVGALADWFAVTAIFRHPMKLKIPHTNLIEKSKNRIGNSIGNFIVDNFLTSKNIRPYILNIKVAKIIGEKLYINENQDIIIKEINNILANILTSVDNKTIAKFINEKLIELSDGLKLNVIVGGGIKFLVENNTHQNIITYILKEIKKILQENPQIIRDKVKKESFFFVPNFIDEKVADKILSSINEYFIEIEKDENHYVRKKINEKLINLSSEIMEEKHWEDEFNNIKKISLNNPKINDYIINLWEVVREKILKEINSENSNIDVFIKKNITKISIRLQNDIQLQQKIDKWSQKLTYKYILKNKYRISEIISTTINNWESKELGDKLELEVGKDLQFIRINGTLVGGIVGVFIYTISKLLEIIL